MCTTSVMYVTHRSAAYLVDLHGPVDTAQVQRDLCGECAEIFLPDQVQLHFGALKKNAIHRCGIRDVVAHCCDVGVGRSEVTKYRLEVRTYSSRVVPHAVLY